MPANVCERQILPRKCQDLAFGSVLSADANQAAGQLGSWAAGQEDNA